VPYNACLPVYLVLRFLSTVSCRFHHHRYRFYCRSSATFCLRTNTCFFALPGSRFRFPSTADFVKFVLDAFSRFGRFTCLPQILHLHRAPFCLSCLTFRRSSVLPGMPFCLPPPPRGYRSACVLHAVPASAASLCCLACCRSAPFCRRLRSPAFHLLPASFRYATDFVSAGCVLPRVSFFTGYRCSLWILPFHRSQILPPLPALDTCRSLPFSHCLPALTARFLPATACLPAVSARFWISPPAWVVLAPACCVRSAVSFVLDGSYLPAAIFLFVLRFCCHLPPFPFCLGLTCHVPFHS